MWKFLTFLPDDDNARVAPEPRMALPGDCGDGQPAERRADGVMPPAFLKSDAQPTSDDGACRDSAPCEAEMLDYLRFLDGASDSASDRDFPPDVEADNSPVPDD
jgi:hypothetical protein